MNIVEVDKSRGDKEVEGIIRQYSLSLRVIIARFDTILDQSECTHLYNHLRNNYTNRLIIRSCVLDTAGISNVESVLCSNSVIK